MGITYQVHTHASILNLSGPIGLIGVLIRMKTAKTSPNG